MPGGGDPKLHSRLHPRNGRKSTEHGAHATATARAQRIRRRALQVLLDRARAWQAQSSSLTAKQIAKLRLQIEAIEHCLGTLREGAACNP